MFYKTILLKLFRYISKLFLALTLLAIESEYENYIIFYPMP